ncbi:MAG: acyl-CoA thioesterase [Pirellulaceae bacterium]|nr:acyl-CoA thioesterase [Pirellulaceae bacterium]
MNHLIHHIASGQVFFTGVALLAFAALLSTGKKGIAKRIAFWAFLSGVAAVGVSSTPIPYWCYAIAGLATVCWMLSVWFDKHRWFWTMAVVAVWCMAAAIELPYHIVTTIASSPSRSITIIGDSITAGMGADDESERWPAILAREHGLKIQNLSHVGETAASALKRVEGRGIAAPLVVLEIGGNDLLGSTSSAQFARDLDALLDYVCRPGRQVVMFELPLPPFHNEYGRVQRESAAKHNVALIPKRVLMSILSRSDSTLDTIHLSQTGHRRMAAAVWRHIGAAFQQNGRGDHN